MDTQKASRLGEHINTKTRFLNAECLELAKQEAVYLISLVANFAATVGRRVLRKQICCWLRRERIASCKIWQQRMRGSWQMTTGLMKIKPWRSCSDLKLTQVKFNHRAGLRSILHMQGFNAWSIHDQAFWASKPLLIGDLLSKLWVVARFEICDRCIKLVELGTESLNEARADWQGCHDWMKWSCLSWYLGPLNFWQGQ